MKAPIIYLLNSSMRKILRASDKGLIAMDKQNFVQNFNQKTLNFQNLIDGKLRIQ